MANSFNPLPTYHKYIGRNPLIKAPLFAAGGYLAGRYAPSLLGGLVVDLIFANRTPSERANLKATLKDSRVGKAGGLLGLLGGLGVALAPHMDRTKSSTLGDKFKSSIDSNYWEDRPERKALRAAELQEKRDSYKYEIPFYKKGSVSLFDEMDNSFNKSNIPVSRSLDLINTDAYLDPFSKEQVATILTGAENKESGLISGKQLATSAIRMGASYLPAYMFGKGLGSLLGLPGPVTERVSKIGGIAAAIYNSGIIK